MSEVKGQLLGVLITLTVFGVVAGVIYAVVNQLTEKTSSSAEDIFTDMTGFSSSVLVDELEHL